MVKPVGTGEQPKINKARVILLANKQGAVLSRKRKASQNNWAVRFLDDILEIYLTF